MKLPKRLIHEPQHEKEEKITDKSLTRSIVISVVGILFCMTCLFGLTWAWFSDSIVTSSNKITAASFDLEITVTEQNTENTVIKGEDGYYVLDAEKIYTVTLAKLGTAKTGFCHLSVITPTAKTATVFYTDGIPQTVKAAEGETEPFVFTLSGVSEIKFTPMWGQCPEDQNDKTVQYNGKLSFDTVSMTPPATEQNEETQEAETTAPAMTDAPPATETEQPESTAPSAEPKTHETSNRAKTTIPSKTTNVPETTNPPETTGTPETSNGTETANEPETNVTETPVTAQPESSEPTEQTEPTEPTEP